MFTRGYQVFPISSPTVFGESGAHPKNCTIHDDPRHPREVGVTHAFCPHMGAHLGMGGVVVGNSLQCPFHGWSFNVAGMVWKTSAQCRGYSHWQLGKRRKRGLTHGFGAALFSDKPRYIPISVGIGKIAGELLILVASIIIFHHFPVRRLRLCALPALQPGHAGELQAARL